MKNIKHQILLFFACSLLSINASAVQSPNYFQKARIQKKISQNALPLASDLFNANLQADELKPLPKFELILFPLSFFVSGIEAGVEHTLTNKTTLRASLGYFISYDALTYNNIADQDVVYSEMEGFRSEFQYRTYSRDIRARDNFYFGAFGVFKTISMDGVRVKENPIGGGGNINEQIVINSQALSLGILFGYKIRMYEFMSLDFHFGGGLTPTNMGDVVEAHIPHLNPYRRSINLKGGFTVGVNF